LADSLKRKYRHGQKKNQKLSQQSHNSSISNIGDGVFNNSIESDNGYTKEDDEFVFDCDPFEWSEIISKNLMSLLTNTPEEMAILRGTVVRVGLIPSVIVSLKCSSMLPGLRYLQTVHGRRESQQTKSEEDNHVTFTLGGDFLFLLRNIRCGSAGIVQLYSEKIMIEVMI
jgi:hypothetical protein